jgi:ZIP family zinc transporter
MEIAVLLAAAVGTAVATGLGVVPVLLLGERAEALRPVLWGATAGSMTVAAIVGLLRPAFQAGGGVDVVVGSLAGVAFLYASRSLLDLRDARASVARSASARASVLVFAVLLVHSLPEGFAIGTAYASEEAGLGLFVITAIAIHNIPEGTSVAVPMSAAGYSPAQQFWAAVATSVPQVPGALVAYLVVERVERLLPASFGFAAGAMLALVAAELAPAAFARGGRPRALAAAVGGGLLMLSLAALLQPQ